MNNFALTCDKTLIDLEKEAIRFIQEHEPPEGYLVGNSGGKDSIVLAELMKFSGAKYEMFYSATYIDPPEIPRFLKKHYPYVKWLKPDMTFWQGIRKKKMMPLRCARWCCDILKHATKESKAIPLKHRVMGIRAQESPRRASLGKISKMGKWTIYKPIFDWTEEDIWDYIKKYNMPYCSLYDEGFTRLGCVVCPMIGGKKLIKHRKRFPQFYRILDKHLNELYLIQKEKGNLIMSYDEFMSWPDWKTKEQREYLQKQQNMLQ